jgi:NAD(P)-dependent dehydrogenase (short-subunit alcohol dehydrogenase family)
VISSTSDINHPAPFGRIRVIPTNSSGCSITANDLNRTIELTQPLQRHGEAEDVANALLFLASERATQITGIVMPVDGGAVAGPPVNQFRLVRTAMKERRPAE